ncbi:hypothetical protein LINGRAHAP2_LOCUS27764, partial [Linum grandiflorum]
LCKALHPPLHRGITCAREFRQSEFKVRGLSEGRVRIGQDVKLIATCAQHRPCWFSRVACYSKSVSVWRHQFPNNK